MYAHRSPRLRNLIPEPLTQARSLRKSPSPAESALWQALRGRQICGAKFRRKHSVGHFVLDFWCPEHRLVIEVDGDSQLTEVGEHSTVETERQFWIEANDIRLLRVHSDDILFQPEAVLRRISGTLVPPGV